MYANPNLMEQLSNAYRIRRTAESETLRLTREVSEHQPVGSRLALLLARTLIMLGERLERSVGPQPQPRAETC